MDLSRSPPALCDSLGKPDVYVCVEDSRESLLTPDTLSLGHRVSYDEFGIPDKAELNLTLIKDADVWGSLAGYRKASLQQLRSVRRFHQAQCKKGALYDVPLVGTSLSIDICYPQQHNLGEAARAQWAQELAGCTPLSSLAISVPHGFMRTKLFDMLSEQKVALPRAAWFVQVAYLNRTRPDGWDGGSKLTARSLQCTEDLIAFLEQIAHHAAKSPLTHQVASTKGTMDSIATRATSLTTLGAENTSETDDIGTQWMYMLRLVGSLYCQGLLHTQALASWLIGKAISLPPLVRLDLMPLLHLMLPEISQTPQLSCQVIDTCARLFLSGQSMQSQGAKTVTNSGPGSSEWLQEKQQEGYEDVICSLIQLAPMAFISLSSASLSALEAVEKHKGGMRSGDKHLQIKPTCTRGRSSKAWKVVDDLRKVQQQLAATVNPRVLRLHDAKGMQWLNGHLGTCDYAAAHTKLWKLLLPLSATQQARQQAQCDLICLVCSWAVASPASHMAAALGGDEAQSGCPLLHGYSSLQPGKALMALSLLRYHLEQQQHAEQQGKSTPGLASVGDDVAGGDGLGAGESPEMLLQGALFSWLDDMALHLQRAGCLTTSPSGLSQDDSPAGSKPADDIHLSAIRQQCSSSRGGRAGSNLHFMLMERVLQLAVLLAERRQLDPQHYLRNLLASGILPNGNGQLARPCGRAAFHLEVLYELHPSLMSGGTPSSRLEPQSPAPGYPAGSLSRKRKHAAERPVGGGVTSPALPSSRQKSPVRRQTEYTNGEDGVRTNESVSFKSPRQTLPGDSEQLGRGPFAAVQNFSKGTLQEQRTEAVEEYTALRRAVFENYDNSSGRHIRSMGNCVSSGSWSDLLGPASEETNGPDRSGASGESPHSNTNASTPDRGTYERNGGLASNSEAVAGQVKARLLHLLGLSDAGPAGGWCEAGMGEEQLWTDCLTDISALSSWQRRHVAAWFHGVCKRHVRACLANPSQRGSIAPPHTISKLSPQWLLRVLGFLDMCGAVREPAELLCDIVAVLLRTLASAVVSAPASALSPGDFAGESSKKVWEAYDRFWSHSGLPPTLIFSLVAAHHQQLAALGRLPRLLRMLTAGLWNIVHAPPRPGKMQQQGQDQRARPAGEHHPKQQAQHDAQEAQREFQTCFHPQLRCAAHLLSFQEVGCLGPFPPSGTAPRPGLSSGRSPSPAPVSHAVPKGRPDSAAQQWWQEMEEQHGPQHWVLVELQGLLSRQTAGSGVTKPHQGVAHGGRKAAVVDDSRPASAPPSAHGSSAESKQVAAVALWIQEAVGPKATTGMAECQVQELLEQALHVISESQAHHEDGDSQGGCQQMQEAAEVQGCQASGWVAAERLAAWVAGAGSREGQGPAHQPAQQLLHRAAVAVAAVFQSCAPSERQPGASGADWDTPQLAWHTQCLCRTIDLLIRSQRVHLPVGFLAAAVSAAADQRLSSEGSRTGEEPRETPGNVVMGPCQTLLVRAMCCRVLPLEDLLAAAPLRVLKLVAAEPGSLHSLGFGERWALLTFQRRLPFDVATRAVIASLEEYSHEGNSEQQQQQQEQPPCAPCTSGTLRTSVSFALREASLFNAQNFQSVIACWAAGSARDVTQRHTSTGNACKPLLHAYTPLQGVLACLTGSASRADRGHGSAGVLSTVLSLAEPAVQPLCWLVVRNLLDEQTYLGAVQRGESARSALLLASRQAPSQARGQTSLSEAEKDFTSRVLAELAVRPEAASTLCAVCIDLGKELGEYLLQQLDWVLQDSNTLLGQKPLASVLLRRGTLTSPLFQIPPTSSAGVVSFPPCATRQGPAFVASPSQPGAALGRSSSVVAHDALLKQLGGMASSTALDVGVSPAPFGVEEGFIEACLVCLAASSDSRRRSFAQQLVLQLQRMADMTAHPPRQGTGCPEDGRKLVNRQHVPASPPLGGTSISGQAVQLQERTGASSSHAAQHPPSPTANAMSSPASHRGHGGRGWGGRAGAPAAASAASWGGGSHGMQHDKAAVETVESEAGVHVALWLRLGIIFPLLPLIYSDTPSDSSTNLRNLLLNAVLRSLGSPVISNQAEWPGSDPQAAPALAAEGQAREPLQSRLLHMFYALTGSSWASWLQGGRQLKDVAPLVNMRQLLTAIESMPVPQNLKRAATAALSTAGPASAHLSATTSIGAQAADYGSYMISSLDPWLLLPGGMETQQRGRAGKQDSTLIPHWLKGAVRVRKRDLSYSGSS